MSFSDTCLMLKKTCYKMVAIGEIKIAYNSKNFSNNDIPKEEEYKFVENWFETNK